MTNEQNPDEVAVFKAQAEGLMLLADNALEEAAGYINSIEDKKIAKELAEEFMNRFAADRSDIEMDLFYEIYTQEPPDDPLDNEEE